MTQELLQAAVEVDDSDGSSTNGGNFAGASVNPFASEPDGGHVTHFELARTIERVNRRFNDLLRVEMGKLGVGDIGPAQVMVLFTIGNGDLSVRDLLDKGHYLGSNVSYYLKQLVDLGYIDRVASQRDRRSARISLSQKGHDLCQALRSADDTYHRLLVRDERESRELDSAYRLLQKLEQVWTNATRYGS
jgi:DNA-binding MarR family transcriptional regulator